MLKVSTIINYRNSQVLVLKFLEYCIRIGGIQVRNIEIVKCHQFVLQRRRLIGKYQQKPGKTEKFKLCRVL